MPLASCVRCGKMFNKVQSSVCVACQPDEDADFDKIREVVSKQPDLTMEQVAEAVDVSIDVVQRMLKEGMITSVAMLESVKCGRCGAPAISASKKLCQTCLEKLEAEVARAQSSIRLSEKKKPQVLEYDTSLRKTFEQKKKEI